MQSSKMSEQSLADENATNGVNQSEDKAIEECNEVEVEEQTEAGSSDDHENNEKTSSQTLNQETDIENNAGIDNGHKPNTSAFSKSPALRIAVHGLSELINTRLSAEALDICVDLIEAGVQPRALSEVVLHILDVKVKNYEKEHGPILP